MVSFNAPFLKNVLVFRNLIFKNLFYCSYMQSAYMDSSTWAGLVLDSGIIILEMDQSAECVSTNRRGSIMIDFNSFRIIYTIANLLQHKLSNIAI